MSKINEYPQAVTINNNDLFVIDQESGGDHATKSASVSQIADKATSGVQTQIGDLSTLTTSDKSSLVGAVNEVARYTPVYGNTASGSIATFDTSLALPLQDCTIEINAVQSGSGTPSPDNVRPITGFTECNVTRTGKNLITPTLSPNGNPRYNVTVTKGYDNVILTTTAATDYMCYGVFYFLKKGTYTFKYQANSSDSYTPSATIYRQGSGVVITSIAPNTARTFTLAEDTTIEVRMFASTVGNGVVGRVLTFYEMQLELGTTATDYEPYNSEIKTIDFNGNTVYGGSLDVTSGKLTVTHVGYVVDGTRTILMSTTNRFYIRIPNAFTVDPTNQTTYSGVRSEILSPTTWGGLGSVSGNLKCAPLFGNGIAFRDDEKTTVADWVTYFTNNPTIFTYELATPQTIQLTPTQVSAIVGTNNIFTDTNGNTSVVYACSLKDYIEGQ